MVVYDVKMVAGHIQMVACCMQRMACCLQSVADCMQRVVATCNKWLAEYKGWFIACQRISLFQKWLSKFIHRPMKCRPEHLLVKKNVVLWTHAKTLSDFFHVSADIKSVHGGIAARRRKEASQNRPKNESFEMVKHSKTLSLFRIKRRILNLLNRVKIWNVRKQKTVCELKLTLLWSCRLHCVQEMMLSVLRRGWDSSCLPPAYQFCKSKWMRLTVKTEYWWQQNVSNQHNLQVTFFNLINVTRKASVEAGITQNAIKQSIYINKWLSYSQL